MRNTTKSKIIYINNNICTKSIKEKLDMWKTIFIFFSQYLLKKFDIRVSHHRIEDLQDAYVMKFVLKLKIQFEKFKFILPHVSQQKINIIVLSLITWS